MKIKDILSVLAKSGEDFSDHSTGKEDGNAPLHDKGCAFCEAWSAALYLLTNFEGRLGPDLEPGDSVLICGRAPGKVVAIRTQIDVRLGEPGGPQPVGTFAEEFVTPAPAEPVEKTSFWRNEHGDVFERLECGGSAFLRLMRVISYNGEPVSSVRPWATVSRTFAQVQSVFSLTAIEKP
jgi:hypothetical protein